VLVSPVELTASTLRAAAGLTEGMSASRFNRQPVEIR